MPRIALNSSQSLICVVDLQARFLSGIHEAERVVDRTTFLVKAAKELGIPIIGTEQNVDRMGATLPEISEYFSHPAIPKMYFGAVEADGFLQALEHYDRTQILLVGIETHICVSLTALELVSRGYHVGVCPDATSARTQDRHKLGMERMRDGGIVPAHTEAIAYEWMQTASHPKFRAVLDHVKNHP